MFGIGNLPTGDKDPFALRRHALGIIRILLERQLPLDWNWLVNRAFKSFDLLLNNWSKEEQENFGFNVGYEMPSDVSRLESFVRERLTGPFRDLGYSAQEIDAVQSLRLQRFSSANKSLDAVKHFAALPEAPALAAANKRISNILKKGDAVDAHVSEVLLTESAEIALHKAMGEVIPKANTQFEAGDYTASLQTLAALRAPVDDFFNGVMVNAEQTDLRLNRLGLLATLHNAMNRVADLSKLAS
jgi:glycyl-tRNA synthetase beta chain